MYWPNGIIVYNTKFFSFLHSTLLLWKIIALWEEDRSQRCSGVGPIGIPNLLAKNRPLYPTRRYALHYWFLAWKFSPIWAFPYRLASDYCVINLGLLTPATFHVHNFCCLWAGRMKLHSISTTQLYLRTRNPSILKVIFSSQTIQLSSQYVNYNQWRWRIQRR